MNWLMGGTLVMFGLCFLVWTAVTFSARFRGWILGYYSRRVGLAVPESLEAHLSRRAILLQRATALGGLAGIVVATAVIAVFIPPPDYTRDLPPVEPAMVVLLICATTGPMLSRSLAALMLTLRHRAGRRVARSTTPRLSDYVSGVERAAAWLTSVAALTLLILIWLAHRYGVLQNIVIEDEGVFDSMGAWFAYLAALSLAMGGILSSIVLHYPQPAGSTQELAWDDAIRALTLRWLISVTSCWGLQSIILSFIYVLVGSTWHPAWLVAPVALMFVATWVGWFLLGYFARNSVMDRYYQRRLWTKAEVLVTP